MEYKSAFKKKKEGNPVICDNIQESGRHYEKSDKPSRKRQILHDLIYVKSKEAELTEADNSMVGSGYHRTRGRWLGRWSKTKF